MLAGDEAQQGRRPRRSQVSHRVHSLLLFILCTKTRGGLSLGITDDPYFVLYNVCVFQNDYRKMYSFSLKKCKAVIKKQEQEGDAPGEDHGLLERGQSPTLTYTHPCPECPRPAPPNPKGPETGQRGKALCTRQPDPNTPPSHCDLEGSQAHGEKCRVGRVRGQPGPGSAKAISMGLQLTSDPSVSGSH